MPELANDIHGELFEVPAEATAWRVRRMEPKVRRNAGRFFTDGASGGLPVALVAAPAARQPYRVQLVPSPPGRVAPSGNRRR